MITNSSPIANRYTLISNNYILNLIPSKKVITDYSFNSYIRKVSVQKRYIDSYNKKQLLDSNIYFGNVPKQILHKLNYKHNSLSFIYASDNWAAYEHNEYSYQLIGQDETWSKWSQAQKKEYTNLREGTYTFEVRCKNIYGAISSVATYTFTILPPWYRTWWAYLIYVMGGVGLLVGGSVGYSRFRTRQIRRRNQELSQLVEERTQEIRGKNEEITEQSEKLKTANDELKRANELITKDRDEKIKIYMQEATEATSKLQEIQETLIQKGAETTQKLLTNEINTAGELSIIQDKVRREFPDFVQIIDKTLADGKINKITWQVGYCLKFGKSPVEIAKILPLGRRTISVYGSKLRKIDGLESLGK